MLLFTLNRKKSKLSKRNQATKQSTFPFLEHCPLDVKATSLTNTDIFSSKKNSLTSTVPLWFVLSNRECSKLFGEEGMTLKLFVKRTAPFSILWTLTSYLYLLALKKLTATDVSALYCCHKAFVFLLSWIVLKDRFMGVRVCMRT